MKPVKGNRNEIYSASLYLPRNVRERLDAYCTASGAKVSSVLTRALEMYLPRLERALGVLSDDCGDNFELPPVQESAVGSVQESR